jgi:hypothetical protein
MMALCQKFNRHYFDHVVISNLGTHLNIVHIHKKKFVTGYLPDSNINSYALGISFRTSACFNRRNAGGIFIKFRSRISRKESRKISVLFYIEHFIQKATIETYARVSFPIGFLRMIISYYVLNLYPS